MKAHYKRETNKQDKENGIVATVFSPVYSQKYYLVLTLLYLILTNSLNVVYANNATKLDLNGYQDKNGAITLGYKGNFVDPYFAMRALLIAKDEGMDVQEPALLWINWLIKKQRPDGRFDRYCLDKSQFVSCMPADADDVNMILWAQLLLTTIPTDVFKMSPEFQQSYTNSINYLNNELYDKQLGIYIINKKTAVGLFMDNVEIADAFFQLAEFNKQQNNMTEALQFESQAVHLLEAIEKVFGRGTYYEVSTQANKTKNFYPGAVAQLYPWIFSVPLKLAGKPNSFSKWYSDWNIDLYLPQSDFAWGMIALAAKNTGNQDFVEKWMKSAKNLRPKTKWNVLEETIYQVLLLPKNGTPVTMKK